MLPVEKVLKDAKISKDQITEVVLVGGSTRIPKVQELLKTFMNNKEPCRSINPDEAVAYGAAVQAAILNSDGGEACKDLLLLDVTPLSLGIETTGGVMTTVIGRNTTIPCKKADMFTTDADNQTQIEVAIFEGERYKTKDNNLLGQFTLGGITPAPRGVPQVEITMALDANGILNVSAVDKATGKKNEVTIKNDTGRLSQADVDRMIKEAEQYAKDDEATKLQTAARQDLESYCLQILELCTAGGDSPSPAWDKLSPAEQEKTEEQVTECLEWVEENREAERMEIVHKKRELEAFLKPVLSKMHGQGPTK